MPLGLKIKDIPLFAKTVYKLGLGNVAYVAWYRFTLKSGLRKLWFKQQGFSESINYFTETDRRTNYPESWKEKLFQDADKITKGEIRYYAYHWKEVGNPPNWFLNPFNGKRYPKKQKHWTDLPDFHPEVGDIKNVWEASRFEWVVTLARAYAVSGEKKYLNTLNDWIRDWARENPLNTGPNWKCGQEASIRVFNLLNAAYILNQWQTPTKGLSELVFLHLKRISGNIGYAIAQNNNHGTSEAAALFIGGCWLKEIGQRWFPTATKYAKQGRKWLENRVSRLIANEGSFSQHSVTYHRVMLDTLSFAEFWRQTLAEPMFTKSFYAKARAASHWLYLLVDGNSFDAPNLGSNDGALFLNTHSCNYRDFRPSVQLAKTLFADHPVYPDGEQNEALFWFKLNHPKKSRLHNINPSAKKKSTTLDNAYSIMQGQQSWALLRLPNYKHRPSHKDVFHLDLWHQGKNILCDSGSFSYNPGKEREYDYSSVKAHNTACFDDHEQMPRLGRFLVGGWIKEAKKVKFKASDDSGYWSGSYKDYNGNTHSRSVAWDKDTWVITDQFAGPFQNVNIGFNLMDGHYELSGHILNGTWGQITIEGAKQVYLSDSFYSKHYWAKEPGQRFIAEADEQNQITTTIKLIK